MNMSARNAIRKVALDLRRRYSYRRVTVEVRRRGFVVNHKRVLAMRKRKFVGHSRVATRLV